MLGVHVGFVDTDLARGITPAKSRPDDVVASVLAALEAGKDEILADELSRQVKHGLASEPGVYLVSG